MSFSAKLRASSTFVTLVCSQQMQKTTTPKKEAFQVSKEEKREVNRTWFYAQLLQLIFFRAGCRRRRRRSWTKSCVMNAKNETIVFGFVAFVVDSVVIAWKEKQLFYCAKVNEHGCIASHSIAAAAVISIVCVFVPGEKRRAVEMTNIDRARVICLKCNVCRNVPRFQLD